MIGSASIVGVVGGVSTDADSAVWSLLNIGNTKANHTNHRAMRPMIGAFGPSGAAIMPRYRPAIRRHRSGRGRSTSRNILSSRTSRSDDAGVLRVFPTAWTPDRSPDSPALTRRRSIDRAGFCTAWSGCAWLESAKRTNERFPIPCSACRSGRSARQGHMASP